MVQETDLSEYEKIRLANIKRNADFLSSMGFSVRPDDGTERPHKVEKKPSSAKPRWLADSDAGLILAFAAKIIPWTISIPNLAHLNSRKEGLPA